MPQSTAQRTARFPNQAATPYSSTHEALVRATAAGAVVTSFGYLVWRAAGVEHNLWLSAPLLLLELWGLIQLLLVTVQGWSKPSPHVPAAREVPAVDVLVTCTYHSPEELERTLVACRTVRHVRRTVVIVRPGRPELVRVAQLFGVDFLAATGNHVDAYWRGIGALESTFAAWVEAGQIPMPGMIDAMVGHFEDPAVAVVQSSVGLLNEDSLAHVRGGRDENAFRHQVAFPAQSAHGVAPWHGGGSLLRVQALRAVGGFARNDQAALERSLVRLHATGWKSRYHCEPSLIRTTAPDSLDSYLMLRRRTAIESLRVFRTEDNPLRRKGLKFGARVYHLALASAFGTGVRQFGLSLILLATLLTGALPFRGSAGQWAMIWAPIFLLGVGSRLLLARGTMAVGDWTRQGWRTLAADLSAIAVVTGLRRKATSFSESDGTGLHALAKLRLLTTVLVALDLALVGRGLTVFWPGLLPEFSTSGRVLSLGIGLVVVASMIDVLQVAVRRRQRRSQFRLTTDLPAKLDGRQFQVVDLSPKGMGAYVEPSTSISTDSDLTIHLGLLDAAGERLTVEIRARARSEVITEKARRVGFEFTTCSQAARAALIEYCAIAHHADGSEAEVHRVEPAHFDVLQSHPQAARVLSSAAVVFGLAGLFLGPAAHPALASEATDVSICLRTSAGDPIEGAEATYYASGWKPLGTTGTDGCAVGQAPAAKITLAVKHGGIKNQTTQDTATNPTATFTTKPVTVALETSVGDPIEAAEATYYASGWKPLGATDTDGNATIELLPAKITLAVRHGGIKNQITQDTATNPTATFTTARIAADEGVEITSYYAGGWNPFEAGQELLPADVTFRVVEGSQTSVVLSRNVVTYVPSGQTSPWPQVDSPSEPVPSAAPAPTTVREQVPTPVPGDPLSTPEAAPQTPDALVTPVPESAISTPGLVLTFEPTPTLALRPATPTLPEAAPTLSQPSPAPTQIAATPTPAPALVVTSDPTPEPAKAKQTAEPTSTVVDAPVPLPTDEPATEAGPEGQESSIRNPSTDPVFELTLTAAGRPTELDILFTPSTLGTATVAQGAPQNFALRVTNPSNAEVPSPVVIEFAFEALENVNVSDSSSWACAGAGNVLRCVSPTALEASSSSHIQLSAVPQFSTLLVTSRSPLPDLAVAVVALCGMWLTLSLAHRIPRRQQ